MATMGKAHPITQIGMNESDQCKLGEALREQRDGG